MSNLHNLHAREALNNITGLDTNWAAIGSHPPNEKANGLALRILEAIFSTRTKKPIVAASGEGGVAIVYKENDKYVQLNASIGVVCGCYGLIQMESRSREELALARKQLGRPSKR